MILQWMISSFIARHPCSDYTQRNLFEILWNEPEIRFYLPCTDWFGTANGQCPFVVPNQLLHGKYYLILIRLNNISLCVLRWRRPPLPSPVRLYIKPSQFLSCFSGWICWSWIQLVWSARTSLNMVTHWIGPDETGLKRVKYVSNHVQNCLVEPYIMRVMA